MIKKLSVAALVIGFSLASGSAYADDRVVDGVLGAGAGALVFGPVELVAGGVIGFSAGPGINCSLRGGCGRRRHHYRRQAAGATQN